MQDTTSNVGSSGQKTHEDGEKTQGKERTSAASKRKKRPIYEPMRVIRVSNNFIIMVN